MTEKRVPRSGIIDLPTLLRDMQPYLDGRAFVFCSVDPATYLQHWIDPIGVFREPEGVTLIMEQSQADQIGWSYSDVWALLSLRVHSSLTAVGLLAAITAQLAAAGISANVVSAYHHDHVFVPWAKRERALTALHALSDGFDKDIAAI